MQEIHESPTRKPRLGGIATNHLAMLRERVERQRSVVVPYSKHNSLEEIITKNECDISTKENAERLDSQISSLHQDVTALSKEVSEGKTETTSLISFYDYLKVRNAMQALQEMATTPSHHYSAHSNPNITDVHHSSAILARSTSHPPEMFCWDGKSQSPSKLVSMESKETQTDGEELLQHYVQENPKIILQILGLDAEKLLNRVNLKKSHSNPDYTCRNDRFSEKCVINVRNKNECNIVVDEESEEEQDSTTPFLWGQQGNNGRRSQYFESRNQGLVKHRRSMDS